MLKNGHFKSSAKPIHSLSTINCQLSTAIRKLACVLALSLLFGLSAMPASAESLPSGSYTHHEITGGGKKTVRMKDMYYTAAVIDWRSLGLEKDFAEITDVACDKSGNTWILSSDSRIIKFDENGNLLAEYTVDDGGEAVNFNDARGIYIHDENNIYIADTKNNRVLHLTPSAVTTPAANGGTYSPRANPSEKGAISIVNRQLSIVNRITSPESALLPENFVFSPTGVSMDSKGYLYVISEGCFYGALMFGPNGGFAGFYGANTVSGASPLSTLQYFWNRLTKNDVKRAAARKQLPYQFVDMYIDDLDFVFTCTATATGQLKKLSPGGSNILYKQGWDGSTMPADAFNFGEYETAVRNRRSVQQLFTGIQTDGEGFIYALEQTLGKLYVFDTNCASVTVFNVTGAGKQISDSRASSITLCGTKILVADSLKNTVTIYERTPYGELVFAAQSLTLASKYTEAQPLWEQVLEQDSNSQLALRGLAKAAFVSGDDKSALKFAKSGIDGATYGQALSKAQSAFLTANFPWILLLVLALIGAVTAFMVISRKRKLVLVKNEKLRVLANGMLHPFDSFNAVKYKKMGSMPIALAMMGMFYLSAVISATMSDFRYTSFDGTSYNALFQILQTAGLIALWSLANWCVSILQEGKGRLREVFTVTCYSALPLVLYNLIFTPLSHLIPSPGSAVISGLYTIALIFSGIMLTIGLMTVHEFSFPRFLWSAFVALLFALLVIFILFMVGTMLSQFWTFIVSVFVEFVYR